MDHLSPSSSTEFYAGAPTEKPLYDDRGSLGVKRELRTSRHQASAGRREEAVDPREKAALMAILKTAVLLILILVAFFMLWKGIGLYEEKIWLEHAASVEVSPVLKEVVQAGDFDIHNQEDREKFADRIAIWREADRLVRSADSLLQSHIYDDAIDQCQNALRLDPAHMGALERLGQLYFEKKAYVESVNAYIRLLSVDPSRQDVQKRLIQALDAFGDAEAVMYMAKWYQESNTYDSDVQRYLANAHYSRGEFTEAAPAYARVLRDEPKNVFALERQGDSYMQVDEYEKALAAFSRLRDYSPEQQYYQQMAICFAQLLQCDEAVRTLDRAAQLFEKRMVIDWVRDPRFDPIRTDRSFQRFIDRVAGQETRLWLEKMASEQARKEDPDTKLVIPVVAEPLDAELLKPKR